MKDRIRKIRKELRLSQAEFGKRICIGKTSVSKIESGENNPSKQTLILICREFNINEEWLRTGEGDMTVNADNNSYNIKERIIGAVTVMDESFANEVWNFIQNYENDK